MPDGKPRRGRLGPSREQGVLKRRFLRARVASSAKAIRGMTRCTLTVENLGAGGALLIGGSGYRGTVLIVK